jgi:hypothetical protein
MALHIGKVKARKGWGARDEKVCTAEGVKRPRRRKGGGPGKKEEECFPQRESLCRTHLFRIHWGVMLNRKEKANDMATP